MMKYIEGNIKNTENEKILFFLYYGKDVMIIIIYSKTIFINVL